MSLIKIVYVLYSIMKIYIRRSFIYVILKTSLATFLDVLTVFNYINFFCRNYVFLYYKNCYSL